MILGRNRRNFSVSAGACQLRTPAIGFDYFPVVRDEKEGKVCVFPEDQLRIFFNRKLAGQFVREHPNAVAFIPWTEDEMHCIEAYGKKAVHGTRDPKCPEIPIDFVTIKRVNEIEDSGSSFDDAKRGELKLIYAVMDAAGGSVDESHRCQIRRHSSTNIHNHGESDQITCLCYLGERPGTIFWFGGKSWQCPTNGMSIIGPDAYHQSPAISKEEEWKGTVFTSVWNPYKPQDDNKQCERFTLKS